MDPTIQEAITVNPAQVQGSHCVPAICRALGSLEEKDQFDMAHSFVFGYTQRGQKIIPKLLALIYFCPTNFPNFIWFIILIWTRPIS